MKYLFGLMISALALTGCADDGSGVGNGAKTDDVTPVEVGGKESGSGFKADCFDCAVDGPGAFIETGISDRAFWKVGDTWQVAYELHSDARTQMQPLELLQEAKPTVGLTVLDFTVIETGEHVIGGETRKTATIKITQGQGRGTVGQTIGEQVAVDGFTQRIDLVLNDLWQPVSVREYTKAYPNGRTVKQDPRKALVNLDSAFPYVVPNAYVGADKKALPELSAELSAVAEAGTSQFATREYFHFDLAKFGLSEEVYWGADEPWPFLVQSATATGVLVSHNW
jgi:hypothetical protein